MEKNPKKSKALIITIILIVLLLIAGYFIFKNKDSLFGMKTSTNTFTPLPASNNFITRLFSPLLPSSNSKNLTTNENIKTTYAEAGENIKKGDIVYQVGTNKNNLPIVRKTGLQNQNKFGTALEDINMGSVGNIAIDSSFWGSIKDWVSNIFVNNPNSNNTCTNGANNPPMCTTINGNCINNATNPPLCTAIGDDTNIFPTVTVTATPASIAKGESSTISWESTNADVCNAGLGNGIGKTGSFGTGSLTTSMSYTVTCTGVNGTGSGNVLVIIGGGGGNVCPAGWTGTYPVCTDPNSNVCPPGWTGTFPNCTNTGSCPVGWTGTYPICTNPNSNVCPLGWTGTYPNCTDPNSNVCPPGWTGTFPDCTNTGSCPLGWTGTYPDCTDPNSIFPEVTVTATPSVVEYEGISEISWKSKKAISCDAGNGNSTPAGTEGGSTNPSTISGSFGTGKLTESKAYSVTCIGTDGKSKISGTAFVFVNRDIVIPKLECSDGINNNDNDTLIDATDPECHKSGNPNNPNPNDYDPTWYSENIKWGGDPQCNDKWDNDGDGKIDVQDPDCHSDKIALDKTTVEGGDAKLTETYNAGTWVKTNLESGSLPPVCSFPKKIDSDTGKCISVDECLALNKIVSGEECIDDPSVCPAPKIKDKDTGKCVDKPEVIAPNACLVIEQNPLTFTPEEKARLEVLLRKFYLISSTLRTSDDISTIYNDIDNQENFMNQVDGLTKQCYLDVNDTTGYADFCKRNASLCNSATDKFNKNYQDKYYTAGRNLTLRRGNPWYQKTSGGTFPYTGNNAVDGGIGQRANPSGVDDNSLKNNTTFGYVDYNWLEGNYKVDVNGNYSSLLTPNNMGPGCVVVTGYNDTGGPYTPENCSLPRSKSNPANSIKKFIEGVDFINTERILNIW